METEENKFDWVEFYEELAQKLLEYKNKRGELVNKVENLYSKSGLDIPERTLAADNKIIDIDPFTIFALFNHSLEKNKKKKIISYLITAFDLKSKLPDSFGGVPELPSNSNIAYYTFDSSNKEMDIANLWNLFEFALKYAKQPSENIKNQLVECFDNAMSINGNGNTKITSGLFWIAPETFMTLDKRSCWYIYKSNKLSCDFIKTLPEFDEEKEKLKGEIYFAIIEQIKKYLQSDKSKIKNFKELSLEAYDYSEFINKKNRESGYDSKKYRNWLVQNAKIDKNSIDGYISGLRGIEKKFKKTLTPASVEDCELILKSLKQMPGKTYNNWSSYLRKYIEYIKNENTADIENDYVEQDNTEEEQKLNDELKNYLGQNVIFYGVPGCGKSHEIKKLLEGNEKYSKRVLFHPEYGYSDFVGQVMPVVEEDKVTYGFVSGPFVEILEEAYQDEDHKYFLIIEEINRGNAPAIFGDIFQLLDRDENGDSEYGIYNKEILKFLNEGKDENEKLKEVKIPRNLTILATMNTCDQNVFTLDTAFKRRWRMTRIKNDLDKASETLINNKFSWKDFVKALNYDILARCNDGMLAEDKLLGAYFVKESEIKNAQVFAEKIFMYLWNDVVKYNKEQLFSADLKTLDAVIENFVKGKNVFNDSCGNLASLYSKQDVNNAGENDR